MQTLSIPALSDNIIYVVVEGAVAAVVDPGESASVLKELGMHGVKLEAVLLTHRHADHTAGATALRNATGCAVIGPCECGSVGLDRVAGGGDQVQVGTMTFLVLATPGHTAGHVCYHLADSKAVWTGDTLFVGGCGRIPEGAAETMWRSLCVLRDLPPVTVVHAGHDYSLDNLDFAAQILPGDPAIIRQKTIIRDLVESGRPAASSTIADERGSNVFLRSDTDAVRAALNMRGAPPVSVFAELRRRKDDW